MSEHFHEDDHDSDTEGPGFIHIAGKRLHGNSDVKSYILPNDDEEQHRLDNIQVMFRAYFGDTIIAPVSPDVHKILDCGTGSGIWAAETAKRYPAAEVIGIDISPVHRTEVPANCEFIVGDINTSLSQFADETFDFVHSRMVMMGVTKDQWPNYVAEIDRILKPGGWVQCSETTFPMWDEGTIPEDSNYVKARKMFDKIIGDYIIGGEHIDSRFAAIGFKHIKVIDKVVDIGTWRGSQDLKLVKGQVAAMSVYGEPVSALAMTLEDEFPDVEERQKFGEMLKKEFMTSKYPMYVKIHSVIGRKEMHIPIPDLHEWNKNFDTELLTGHLTPHTPGTPGPS